MPRKKQRPPNQFRPYPPLIDMVDKEDNLNLKLNIAYGAMKGVPAEMLLPYSRQKGDS